ncbi:TPA: hypothetical protein PC487_003497, partial [Clostridioides difficile]|nr:hypothetical protein [Clostridioides difficile]
MEDINIEKISNIIKENNSVFLCGNGFSINFDNDFRNIFNRLYESHKILIHNSKYEINSDN